jgi:hypothetical protein
LTVTGFPRLALGDHATANGGTMDPKDTIRTNRDAQRVLDYLNAPRQRPPERSTIDLDAFVMAYLECAAWSTSYSDGEGRDRGENGENNLDEVDAEWSDEAQEQARKECADFIEANRSDLEGLDAEQCGHDFWLTRNGHGAGFWDRGYGPRGDRLADASKPWGSVNPWFDTESRTLRFE